MNIRFVVMTVCAVSLGLLLVSLNYCGKYRLGEGPMIEKSSTIQNVISLFSLRAEDVEHQTDTSIKLAQQVINSIIAIPDSQRTYGNTARVLDELSALSNLAINGAIFSSFELLTPDADLRDASHEGYLKIVEFSVDQIDGNEALYKAFKAYVDGNAKKEMLSDAQRYFLANTMKDFERAGLGLPDEQRAQVKILKKDLATLASEFERNVAQDKSIIVVERDALIGLKDDFIANLERTEDGKYILGVDYPTYFNVMDNCAVADTRRQLFIAFSNRAYPVNETILKDMIAKREELARLLGYGNYADYDIDQQMASSADKVYVFLQDLLAKSAQKVADEVALLIADMPESVKLTTDGKVQSWDFLYMINEYKKKHFDIDERKIAEYFPMEYTVGQLLDIYRQFMGVEFEEVPVSGLWHEDVTAIQVFDKERTQLLGTLFLDLYPRPNKYSHAAHQTIIPAVIKEDGTRIPDVSIVMANFPKSTVGKPSLLKRSDVKTFFHEFGHAIHAILGATEIASLSGTRTKGDFVELPSQMLEQWLWDKNILKKVSRHYQTGESLPDDIIDSIVELKTFTSGSFVQRQGYLAMLSLDYHKEGEQKDLYAIMKQLHEKLRPLMAFAPEDHFYTSWGHIASSGYASKYYGYLWSNIFAFDVFSVIKKHGLLDPVIGKKYVQEILSKGGSQDPNELLRNFLGRDPSNEAFLKDMGLI